MARAIAWVLVPSLVFLGGCQAIAGLEIPTYRASSSAGSGGATGSGGAGSGGGAGAGGGSGAGGPCAMLATGQGGACTKSPDLMSQPPCPEHIRLWLIGDRKACITEDAKANVSAWQDAAGIWTVTTTDGTAATWEAVGGGRRAVHVANGSLQLQPSQTIDFSQVGVFAAIRWVTLPPNDSTHPFGAAQILCFSSRFTNALVDVHIAGQPGQAHLEMAIVDKMTTDRLTVSNSSIPTDQFDVYGTGYACDGACATDAAKTPLRYGFFDTDNFIMADANKPSLDPAYLKWQGKYEGSKLGAKCGLDPTLDYIDAQIGEILVYDDALEATMGQDVYQYLTNRWGQ